MTPHPVTMALDEMVSNGIATRSAFEIGQRMSHCQRCDKFRGGDVVFDCHRYPGGKWLDLLGDADRRCKLWG